VDSNIINMKNKSNTQDNKPSSEEREGFRQHGLSEATMDKLSQSPSPSSKENELNEELEGLLERWRHARNRSAVLHVKSTILNHVQSLLNLNKELIGKLKVAEKAAWIEKNEPKI